MVNIQIDIEIDSHNTYPSITLDVWRYDEEVCMLKISDSEREIAVNAKDLVAALTMLYRKTE